MIKPTVHILDKSIFRAVQFRPPAIRGDISSFYRYQRRSAKRSFGYDCVGLCPGPGSDSDWKQKGVFDGTLILYVPIAKKEIFSLAEREIIQQALDTMEHYLRLATGSTSSQPSVP